MNKYIITFLFCGLAFSNNNAQNLTAIPNFDKNLSLIEKNILIYRIYKTNEVGNDLENGALKPYTSLFNLLPDDGYHLNLSASKSGLSYPDSNYVLFSIYKEADQFTKGNKIVEQEFQPTLFDRFFLIGYDSINNRIKFISGNFFLSKISDDFKNLPSDSNALIKYIQLREYFLQIDNIIILKKGKKFVTLSAESKEIQKKIKIRVWYNNLENIFVTIIN